ncbi:hypothetical protein SCG7086_AW_00190 [Chlamydiales bacterium SCGC AG-110-P3]|nr:hypothetical protein SCG7086_AW_00190 [Chlamydiales bacterium SCGC AG-110-P3]
MATQSIEAHSAPRFQVIKDFLKDRSWPTKSSIRWYIHFNKYGFADRCVKRVGRRVLIDAIEFELWVCDFESAGQDGEMKGVRR